MSSEQFSSSDPVPCPGCGSTASAQLLGPREFPLKHWRRAAPSFAAWLADRGWPEDWSDHGRVGTELGWAARVSPCSHQQSTHALAYLGNLEAQLAEKPEDTPAPVRRELLAFLDTLLCMPKPEGAQQRLTGSMRAHAVHELTSLAARLPHAATFSDEDHDTLHWGVTVLVGSRQAWTLTRALIELLRAAPVPTLAPDLKYWGDRLVTDWQPLAKSPTPEDAELAADAANAAEEDSHRRQRLKRGEVPLALHGITESEPPAGWAQIPSELGYALHHVFADAEDSDPQLERLRIEFARYLLRRLKPGDRFEPSVEWRIGYIHAVVALRVNPDGRGHRVLHHVQSEDPSPQVKVAARTAYSKLRACAGLTGSPRRACLDAIWELFRAHMRALDAEVDEAGALRVKREMIRRTTRPKEE